VDRRPALSLDDGITDPAGQWYGQEPTTKEDQAARLEGSSLDVQKTGRVAEPHTRGCGVRMGRPDYMVVGEEAHLPPSSLLRTGFLGSSHQPCSGRLSSQEQPPEATHHRGWLFCLK
jgi:hypothetical protein